jgi:Cu2+-containing amine oxidase
VRPRLALGVLLLACPASAALFKSKAKPKPKTEAPAPAPPGPFDTLSAAELSQAAAVLRGSGLFGPESSFPVIDVQEPAKDELAASTGTRARQAFAVVYDSTRTQTSEAVVDLSAGKLVSWRLIPSAARRPEAEPPAERPNAPAPRLPWLGLETDGRRFKWRSWSFHLSVHPREGVVLHDVRWDARRLLHRASLSEIVALSTRAPSGYAFLLAGRGLAPALLPADPKMPAWPSYPVDAVFADDQGRPYSAPAAAALFERPSEHGEPELVIAQRAQTPTGELLLTWVLGTAGTLDARAQLGPGQDAPPEQDLLSYRLDFEVDGATNSLLEISAEPARGSAAPASSRLALRSEREARRDASASGARAWVV